MQNAKRPLSPHLTIYRKQISTVLSILHRITGVWLFFGSVLLVVWLYMLAYAPDLYLDFYTALRSILGQIFLFSWAAAFYYHLSNGIRHLFWDIGKGYEVKTMNRTGWFVVLFASLLTIATFGYVHGGMN